ncbi:MAG: hypothetical protein U9N19_00660 [Thermodesulfobacteriota bacterium]|nr:hypothetical protein [Thermodesulfobacteriota bacterium]
MASRADNGLYEISSLSRLGVDKRPIMLADIYYMTFFVTHCSVVQQEEKLFMKNISCADFNKGQGQLAAKNGQVESQPTLNAKEH